MDLSLAFFRWENILMISCVKGLRFGDSYDSQNWKPTGALTKIYQDGKTEGQPAKGRGQAGQTSGNQAWVSESLLPGGHTRCAQFFQPWALTLVKHCLPGKLIRDSVPKVLIRGWSLRYYLPRVCAQSLQSRPTLCDPMDYSPPGSSVLRILQARILERVAMPSSRGSFQPRDVTDVSYVCLAGGF